MLFAGDILLGYKLKSITSMGIAAKYNAEVSHVEPIINSKGDSIKASFYRVKYNNIGEYFDGKHRVWIIRPTKDYTRAESRLWVETALAKVGKFYDFNYFRYIVNWFPSASEDNYWNCAEVALDCFQTIGRYEDMNMPRVNPYVFEILAQSGDFTTVFHAKAPTQEDFQKLLLPSI